MSETYRVVVTREDGAWLAELPDLAGGHTYARTLAGIDRAAREVIVLAAGLPEEAMPTLTLDWEYHTGDADLDTTVAEVRALRNQAHELAASASARTAAAAVRLVQYGHSVRDVAAALGISSQRVSQLTGTSKAS